MIIIDICFIECTLKWLICVKFVRLHYPQGTNQKHICCIILLFIDANFYGFQKIHASNQTMFHISKRQTFILSYILKPFRLLFRCLRYKDNASLSMNQFYYMKLKQNSLSSRIHLITIHVNFLLRNSNGEHILPYCSN